MKKTIDLLKRGFYSSVTDTPEFLNFVTTFKNEFTKVLTEKGCTDITISKGHFYVSGFFTYNKQPYYFNTMDVRGYTSGRFYYRRVKNYNDFEGGVNTWSYLQDFHAVPLK